jgi:penicillin-binding protein 2
LFDVFLDNVKRLLKSRLFPITIIYLVLFAVIINQLFILQIVEGTTIEQRNELRDVKTRDIRATRGNIYDRNGKLLASNVLTYSVVMEDSTKIKDNAQRNEIIHRLIQIIEANGDSLDTEFYIKQKGKDDFEFTVTDKGSDKALTRFKKNAFAYVLEDNTLTEEQEKATAKEVFEFLRHGTGNAYTKMFDISEDYSVEEALKIMAVRYALFLNFPKYAQITIASNISDTTVAAIKENGAELLGVSIQQQTHRVYEDSLYFAHIIGYTGLISSEELKERNKEQKYYDSTDIIGKSGLEKIYEKELGGIKGTETVSTNTAGKVIEVLSRTDPVAGSDIYLTIDSDLQRDSYHILEKKIAGILLDKLRPNLDYGSKGESASDITIPIFEVYYALINNNIIDIYSLNDQDSTDREKQIYKLYENTLQEVFNRLDTLLDMNNVVVNNQSGDMEDYLKQFYSVVEKNLFVEGIPSNNTTLTDYKNNKLSLSGLLKYALANNWINLTKLGDDGEYYSAEEWYQKLIDYTKDILKKDDKFNKLVYRNLVFSYKLSGTEICLLLFDQGVLEYNEEEIDNLSKGRISAYNFITGKIKTLEITPAMLALEPCSGSLVVTDVKTGEVRALVTYPSYDNNKFTGKVEYDYYVKLTNDKSSPLINRPVLQRTAPGSTFKMVTSFAALEEGVVFPEYEILDLGIFDKISNPAKCHKYPGTHGSVNISDALKVSCNYFFYEVGYRLSFTSGKFSDQDGLSKLAKYAALFGLNETSGLELEEAKPHISDTDAVRSSIGQGSNDYTPVQLARYITTLANHGTCYDLTLIDKIVDKNGQVYNNEAKVNHTLSNVSETTWKAVYEGMYRVANTQGGSVYDLFKDFGVTVAGKTGTAQRSKVSPNDALFVSFAPYQDPEIAITAVIPNGYTSGNAAELSKDIYKLYFELEDSQAILEQNVTLPETTNRNAAAE